MTRWHAQEYELTYELDGDFELGAPMSVDVFGHIDYADQQLVMAQIVEDEFYQAGEYFEVEHLWRTQYPAPDFEEQERWTFGYSAEPSEGAIAVTRFQIASYWPYLCVNHPDELATIGFSIAEVVAKQHHLAIEGRVYLCEPCGRSFSERRAAAIKAAVAEDSVRRVAEEARA
jgi:hypothetical protein